MRTQVYREAMGTNIAQVNVGTSQAIVTFTATRKLRIRGWSFAYTANAYGFALCTDSAEAYVELTRSVATLTNFGLDTRKALFLPYCDVAAADIVGGTNVIAAQMERYLTPSEADELGLLLDYGESIRLIVVATCVAGANVRSNVQGHLFYEEVGV